MNSQLLESYSKELKNIQNGKDILNLRESMIKAEMELLQYEEDIKLARAISIQNQRPKQTSIVEVLECPN